MPSFTIPDTHKGCLDRMRSIESELEELASYKRPTRSQTERAQELKVEFDALDSQRLRIEGDMALERRSQRLDDLLEGALSGRYSLMPGARTAAEDDHDPYRSGSRVVDAARRILDAAVRSEQLPDHSAETVEKLIRESTPAEHDLTARWVTTTGAPAYMRAFTKIAADPTRGHLLWTEEERAAFQAASELRAAMSLTDANGGYLVPFTLDPTIRLTSAGSINPLRQISRVERINTDVWHGVTSAGVTAEWKAEGSQAADASPTVGQPSIPVHFCDAFVPFSFEVGMDGYHFAEQITRLLLDGLDQLQATAFTTGSGTGQPTGIVTALAGTGSEVSPTVAETFSAADLYKVLEAVPPRFRANAQWTANLSVLNLVDQFETTNGAKKFPDAHTRILNRPVHENSNMDGAWSASATANNYVLIAGDWQNFVIVDRIGTTVEFLPNLTGANGRPTGQRGLFMWARTGSDSVNDGAFAMLNIATTA